MLAILHHKNPYTACDSGAIQAGRVEDVELTTENGVEPANGHF